MVLSVSGGCVGRMRAGAECKCKLRGQQSEQATPDSFNAPCMTRGSAVQTKGA